MTTWFSWLQPDIVSCQTTRFETQNSRFQKLVWRSETPSWYRVKSWLQLQQLEITNGADWICSEWISGRRWSLSYGLFLVAIGHCHRKSFGFTQSNLHGLNRWKGRLQPTPSPIEDKASRRGSSQHLGGASRVGTNSRCQPHAMEYSSVD